MKIPSERSERQTNFFFRFQKLHLHEWEKDSSDYIVRNFTSKETQFSEVLYVAFGWRVYQSYRLNSSWISREHLQWKSEEIKFWIHGQIHTFGFFWRRKKLHLSAISFNIYDSITNYGNCQYKYCEYNGLLF